MGLGVLSLFTRPSSLLSFLWSTPDNILFTHSMTFFFIIYGFSLLAISFGHRRSAGLIGILISGYGMILFVLLANEHLRFLGGFAGLAPVYRVPAGSALNIFLAGFALSLMGVRRRPSFLTISIISGLLTARSLMVLFHLLGIGQKSLLWFQEMSVASAIGFVIISVGVLAFIYREKPAEINSAHWVPITSVIGILAITLSFWQIQVSKDKARIEQLVRTNGVNISLQLKLVMENRLRILNGVRRSWFVRGKPTFTQWQRETRPLFRDYKGFRALGWLDPTLQLQWRESPGRENFTPTSKFFEVAGRAQIQDGIVFEGPAKFTDDKPSFIAMAPAIGVHGRVGLIFAEYDVDELISTILSRPVNNDFSAHVDFNATNATLSRTKFGTGADGWTEPILIRIGGKTWALRVAPTDQFIARNRSYLAEATLATGGMLSMVIGIIIYFLQSFRHRARQLLHANAALEKEAALRRSTQASYADQSERLQSTMDAIGDAVVVANKEGRIVFMNPAAIKMMHVESGDETETGWHLPVNFFKPDTVTPYTSEQMPLLRAIRETSAGAEEMFARFPRSGEEKWMTATTRTIVGRDGQVKGAVSVFRDTTELKRSEDILRAHEWNLANAQHIAQIGSWEWDIRTDNVMWSDELYRIYGLTPNGDPLKYDEVMQRTHPDDRDLFVEKISQALRDKKPFEFVHRIVRPNGDLRVLQARGEVFVDANDLVVKMVGTGQDITERRKSEEALRRSQEEFIRLASIVESSGDSIIGTTLDGTIDSWNRGAEKLYGYRKEEIIGKSIAVLFPEDKVEELNEKLERIRRMEPIGDHESVRLRKDGIPVPVSVITSPVKNREGEVLGASIIARDITRRIEAEQALRESQRLFNQFMDNSPTVAFMKDEEGRYVYVNRTFEKLYDQKLANMKGKSDFEWLPNQIASELQKNDKAALEAEHVVEAVERIPVADGSVRDWLVFRFVVNSTSNKKLLGGVAVDISERRKAEDMIRRANAELELRVLERTRELDMAIGNMQTEIIARKRAESELAKRAEELAVSNQELEQFAMIASHDLQEPLRKISSYGGLLSQRYKGQIDDKADKFIGHMTDGVQRMQNLIKGLLAYARIGRMGIPFRKVNLIEVVQQTLSDLESVIQENDAVVTYENLPSIQANPSQMGQLFQNLISNALKFRGRESPRIQIWGEQRANEWVIAVKDNGIGIEKQYVDRIFQIFQRLHSQKDFPGTGIGLAVCKKIVEIHGGKIWLQSEKGMGTTFFFSLPTKVDVASATPLAPVN